MRRSYLIIAGCAALATSIIAVATTLASSVAGDDPIMEALCSIPPIMNEQAFLENRVEFNWLGTTGTISRLPVSVPGYTPTTGARMEEMNLHMVTVPTLANVALGSGIAWARATPNMMSPELYPTEPQRSGAIIRYALVDGRNGMCPVQSLVTDYLQRAARYFQGTAEDPRGNENLIAMGMRDELEISATAALGKLAELGIRGRCLRAERASREDLPLHAYRAYEYRRRGPYSYALSPHIVTRGGEVVYFSMGVVRQSQIVERLQINGPDPAERVCCVTPLPVGGCSRYGGPDPYMFHVRGLRAAWRPGQPMPKE